MQLKIIIKKYKINLNLINEIITSEDIQGGVTLFTRNHILKLNFVVDFPRISYYLLVYY